MRFFFVGLAAFRAIRHATAQSRLAGKDYIAAFSIHDMELTVGILIQRQRPQIAQPRLPTDSCLSLRISDTVERETPDFTAISFIVSISNSC